MSIDDVQAAQEHDARRQQVLQRQYDMRHTQQQQQQQQQQQRPRRRTSSKGRAPSPPSKHSNKHTVARADSQPSDSAFVTSASGASLRSGESLADDVVDALPDLKPLPNQR